jgi:imidazole glycerol-phosphate synthase subunit HisH
VVVVDYGVGNLLSVTRAFAACDAAVEATGAGERIEQAERLVLPGVGAFANCMGELRRLALVEPVLKFLRSERPFLGICVGFQMLMEVGEEFGEHRGLGIVAGRVAPIPAMTPDGRPQKIPHIGWSALQPSPGRASWQDSILSDVAVGSACYFLHSFSAEPSVNTVRLADCSYRGRVLCAAIQQGNIFGTQFHPEKSGRVGLTILSTFVNRS